VCKLYLRYIKGAGFARAWHAAWRGTRHFLTRAARSSRLGTLGGRARIDGIAVG